MGLFFNPLPFFSGPCPLVNAHGRAHRFRHDVQSRPVRFARSSIPKQNISHHVHVICDGSPSRIRSVRRISFGMTTLPKSSILLTMPVALMNLSSSVSNHWSVVQSYYEPKDTHLCKNMFASQPKIYSQKIRQEIRFLFRIFLCSLNTRLFPDHCSTKKPKSVPHPPMSSTAAFLQSIQKQKSLPLQGLQT